MFFTITYNMTTTFSAFAGLKFRNDYLLAKLIARRVISTYTMQTSVIFRSSLQASNLCNGLNTSKEFMRRYSIGKRSHAPKSLTNREEDGAVQMTVMENVKEKTTTAFYLGVIISGVGLAGFVFYAVFSELFSSHSPNRIYAKAFKYVSNNAAVQNAVGDGIKGFGNENRRGRRQHTSYAVYEKDGVNHLRMQFYIKGSRNTGTVHLEMKENNQGKYEYRYLFVTVGRKVIILEDNRGNVADFTTNDIDASSFT